jgi:hypothetical protein
MSEKPGDFFLGVIDFFGILVPGIALLALQGSTLTHLAAIPMPPHENWWDWVPALVAAYVIGHFLLALGVPLNSLAAVVYPEAKDHYFQGVRNQVPVPPGVTSTRRTVFNAAFSFIRIASASALAEIERQAAEYKLFRSLTMLFLIDALLSAATGSWSGPRLAADAILTLSCCARFLYLFVWTQRLAFEFFALLTRQTSPLPEAPKPEAANR